MLSEERQREMFERFGNEPVAWYIICHNLLTASEILFVQYKAELEKISNRESPSPSLMGIMSVIKMLRAMALENLLKALWLKGGGLLVEEGKCRGIPNINNHDLVAIADKVKETIDCGINDPERDLLRRLSLSITGGRYPIQRKWEQSKIQKLHGGGIGPASGGWNISSDEELFHSLVRRLHILFEESAP